MPIEVLILIFGLVFGIGGFILAGLWLSMKKPREVDEIMHEHARELESLRTELQQITGSVHHLHERVDFTERLLSPPGKVDSTPGETD